VAVKNIDNHIERTPGIAGGKPRIAGRRIKVQDIAIWHEKMGMNADEIASEYDLTLAQIHAALCYYFDHRDEIEDDIARGRAFAEELRKRTPSLLTQRLKELADGDQGG
jgi:uncharacterized protein (DUF433 family)